MKKLISITLLLLVLGGFGSTLSAQSQISYEVIEDNPKTVRNKFVALEFLNADIGGNRNTNTIGIGANAVIGLTEKIGVEGRFNYAIFKEKTLPACFQFQAGGYMGFFSKEKKKDNKVRIGGTFDTRENKHVYDEKFIIVPGIQRSNYGLRAGLYMNKKGYKDQDIEGKPEIPYTLFGLYGGFSLSQKTNLVVQITGSSDEKEDLPEKPLHYTGFTRVYADVILTPVATRAFPTEAMANLSEVKNTLLGGRIGFQFYKDGPKWYNKFMWGVETGVRPIDGFFFNVAAGYSIYRGR